MAVDMVGSPAGTMAAGMHYLLVVWVERGDVAGGSDVLSDSGSSRAPIRIWMFFAPRACPGDLVVTRGSCRAKGPRFVADDGDACGHRYLLEDVVMVFLSVSEFWVKTSVYCRLGNGDA
ncbi:Expansin-B2 [Hordeum vulgare]|nr:Expansin-B2 [Hordeum vulgare]